MKQRLDLQRFVAPLTAEQRRERHRQQARRVEDARLHVGEEGRTAVVVRIPERDLADAQTLELIDAESVILRGEIATYEADARAAYR